MNQRPPGYELLSARSSGAFGSFWRSCERFPRSVWNPFPIRNSPQLSSFGSRFGSKRNLQNRGKLHQRKKYAAIQRINLCQSAPRNSKSPLVCCAVGQIQINQGLVRNTGTCGHFLEIVNGIRINIDRNLFLQPFGIWILFCLGKIIFISHDTHLIQSGHCMSVPHSLSPCVLK